MGSFSVLGIIVASGAVVAAYCMGYSNGRTVGRDEGFAEGKQEGSREGSMRAYAVGFDRGKRARAGNKDGDSGNATANLGIAIFALMLGLLLFLWHSSSTGADPQPGRADPITLPRVNRSLPTASAVPEDFPRENVLSLPSVGPE